MEKLCSLFCNFQNNVLEMFNLLYLICRERHVQEHAGQSLVLIDFDDDDNYSNYFDDMVKLGCFFGKGML